MLAGFKGAVHVVNAVLLTAVLSATESCFYASSRMLLSLAKANKAPKILVRQQQVSLFDIVRTDQFLKGYTTKRGVPIPALL